MQTEQAHGRQETGLRLGGARADFVASLGRKVSELRTLLGRLRTEPEARLGSSPTAGTVRDEFRRKLQALGTGAKLLKFDLMERAIAEALGSLDRAGQDRALDPGDLDGFGKLLDDLPALAWGESGTTAPRLDEAKRAPATHSALVVGSAMMAEALLDPPSAGRPSFLCQSTPDPQAAYDLARSMAPDLVVLDADLDDAPELVDALMDDPATETVPVVVIGSFLEPGEAARYVAMGVARTVSKPTSREALRATCEGAIETRRGSASRLGEPTLEHLGDRLASELRDALVGCVDVTLRTTRVPLGEGNDVMGPIWGAIARVREIVVARTDGAVSFGTAGPGNLPPLHEADLARGDRMLARPRGMSPEVSLEGRRAVVADDDPAVVWFMADLLKAAGCTVYEAFDGQQAIEVAYRTTPHLVVSDILMPKLDGLSLCRALRRDVALRDTPVVLLSWKEDMLQRVRELGAGAAAYVRKESDSRAIVARILESLKPRARIEARLREGGEVRGRLDGLSVQSLLEMVCATRNDARVSVRDASFLYEVEVRGGVPRRAIRTAGDGSLLRGTRVLASMLGVGAGRFTVATSSAPVEHELEGDLTRQLAQPIARARAATELLTGPGLRTVSRVRLDEQGLADYLRAVPMSCEQVAQSLKGGAAPREILTRGECDPGLLEDLLCDVASRGIVVGVEGEGGKDLLGPACARIASVQSATTSPSLPAGGAAVAALREAPPASDSTNSARPGEVTACADVTAPSCTPGVPATAASPAKAPTDDVSDEAAPCSLEDLVLREMQRSPEPARASRVAHGAAEPAPATAKRDEADAPKPVEAAPSTNDSTDVESTTYAAAEPSIPIQEASRAIAAEGEQAAEAARAESDRTTETPFSVVSADREGAGLPTRSRSWSVVAVLAIAAVVFWAVAHFSGAQTSGQHVETAPPPEQPLPARTTTEGVTYSPVSRDVDIHDGHGILAVEADGDITVDGTSRSKDLATVTLAAGLHEIRVRSSFGERSRSVAVRAGEVASLKF